MARIKIIVAVSENGVIGIDDDLPWHIPTDLKHFKSTTEDNIVIMGRKCWESIPDKFRPFKNRLNIVLTKNKNYKADGALVYNDLNLAINDHLLDDRDIFIIGGSKIYEQSFPLADTLYLTKIKGDVKGDTFLKGYNKKDWKLINKSESFKENGFEFSFEKYKSKNIFYLSIIGSKGFDDYKLLKKSLFSHIEKISFMITGYSSGANKLAEKWADENNIKKLIFKPDQDKYGELADSVRNKTIVENSDLIIAFWDGKSKGTKNSIDLAQKLKRDILIIHF